MHIQAISLVATDNPKNNANHCNWLGAAARWFLPIRNDAFSKLGTLIFVPSLSYVFDSPAQQSEGMYTVAEKLGNNSRESHGFKTMHTFRTTSGSSVYILACSSQVRTIVVYITGQLKEKNYTFDICCCSTTALIIKSKYRLAQSQDNISD